MKINLNEDVSERKKNIKTTILGLISILITLSLKFGGPRNIWFIENPKGEYGGYFLSALSISVVIFYYGLMRFLINTDINFTEINTDINSEGIFTKLKDFFSGNKYTEKIPGVEDGNSDYVVECDECGFKGNWLSTPEGIRCPQCDNTIEMHSEHPEKIEEMFYQTAEGMKKHLMKFLDGKEWEDKWEDSLLFLINSDKSEEKIEKFKKIYEEVVEDA